MPPRIPSASIHAPTPLPFTSLPSGFPVTRADKPATATTEPQAEETPLDASDSQLSQSKRPRRTRTPTERGAQLRQDIERSHALSAKIRQTKALNAAGQAQGVRKGPGKRRASTTRSQASGTDDEDFEDGDPNTDDDELDGYESSVVPTSDTRELLEEIIGESYQDELNDPEFRRQLASDLSDLFKDKNQQKLKKFSRETLQEVLRFVRRGPPVSDGASQWNTSIVALPAQVLKGGSGYHRDHESQPGGKRRSDAPQPESSKRGRMELSRTPSTVLENTPPPFGLSAPARQPGHAPPQGPPPTAALLVSGMPRNLPSTNAVHVPEGIWERRPSQSPSPLPASFCGAPDNTQTVPEDTQMVPEDTQTIPEDTQMVPEATEPEADVPPSPAPSSPDLGAPLNDRQPAHSAPRLPLSSSPSLGGNPTSHAVPTSTRNDHSTTSSQANSTRVQQLEAMAERFDRNERNRERAFQIYRNRRGGMCSLDADDVMEVDAADRADAQKSAKGKPAKRKPKTGLNCQPGRPRQVGARAVTDSTACAFAIGPYLHRGSYLFLAAEAYERSWVVEFPHLPLEPAIPDMLSAIADRAPGGRTVAKRNLRPLMTSKTGYGFQENPSSQAKIDSNIALCKSIREDFHFGSLTDRQTHYEHPALEAGFVLAFFQDRHSPCAVYHTYFAPAVPPQSIGFLLTLMESCIAEWSTGVYMPEDLNSKEQLNTYKKHMRNLEIFADEAPGRFQRMRESFYVAGCRNSVHEANQDASAQATIRREEIRPDSPRPAAGAGVGAGNNA